ncbi:ribonuclease H-like domain-containing protein [Tanacetum coccineum]
MEEYIRLEEERAQSRGEMFNWQNARFGRMEHYYKEECFTNFEAEFSAIVLGNTNAVSSQTSQGTTMGEYEAKKEDFEIEFPAIILNDTSTSDTTLSYEPTVSLHSKDEIDFRILFDESDDEDYTNLYVPFGTPFDPKRYYKDGAHTNIAVAKIYSMAGSDDEIPPPPPQTPTQQAPHTVSTIKLPILKKGEYDIWAMKMEHYLSHTDYPIWEVIQKGNGPVSVSTDTNGVIKVLPPKTAEEILARERERKARTTLLMALPEDHLAKFHKMTDAKDIWDERIIEIQAYTQALKKVEAQLVAHQQSQLWYEEKIRFMKIDLDDKTDVLTYHKKLLAEAEKEKEDLKAKVEKWHNSSKNLNILLNSQMSAKDKAGLGYGDQMNKSVLSYENEVFQSVFVSRTSDIEDSPVNDRYAEGMHAVPPPMTGIYIPSGPDKEIDDSQFTYGPKQSKPSESDARSSDFNSCESNCSEETHESMPEPVVNEPKVVSEPKVWSDAPIIEEYESDSEDEHVSLPTKEQEIPSFAFINTDKHVKTPRQTVIEQNTCSQSPKPDKKDCSGLMSKKLGLGFGYTKKACFVCGSFSHLIRDCDFHEKRMAKQAELNNRMSKGSSQREIRPVWNNVQRMNHQNQFVPKAVLTRTGKIPVNTARTSSTNTVNTARHNFNSQAVPINAARKVNTVKPIVNNARPKAGFHKSVSPFRKSFNRTTTLRTNVSKQKDNTAEVNAVSAVKGKRETAVKSSAGCNWRPKRHYWNQVSKYNGGSNYPYRALQNKGIVDSGCSRHMTGNKAYLAEYQDFNGGPVAFGGCKCYITGKGKLKIGKLDFEDDYPQRTLQNKGIVDSGCSRHMTRNKAYLAEYQDFNGGPAAFGGIKGYITSKGIKREYNNARTPQQNGVAERKNRTLIEAARTMLADLFLPNTFWAEAVSTACYVLNRVLVTKPQNKTPYELITGKIPIISYIRPFGCHVTILNTIEHLGKFDGKSNKAFLVGYFLQSKAFRVYNLETKRVEENMHITFLENKPNVAGKGPTWLFDFGLEVEIESTAALDLIRRIAKDVKETLRSDQDLSECLNTSSMEFKESTLKKHKVKQVQQ